MSALLLPEDAYDTYITAPISAIATSIAVNVLPTKTAGYLTIFESDGQTFSEKIYYGGITGTPGQSGTLTSVLRGLALIDSAGVVSDAAGTGVPHVANNRIAMTVNQSYIGHILAVLNGLQESGGVMQNPASRSINSSRDLTDKEYVDAVASAAGGLSAFMVSQNGADPSLTVNIASGYLVLGSTGTNFAGASAQAVTDNQTNYVQLTIAGAVVINTTGFTDGNIPLAVVVAAGADITSITDARGWLTMALTPNQVAALAGSLGTPSAVNKFLTAIDSSSGLDQTQTTQDASATVGEADATTKHALLAQSFIAGNINSTGVELNKQADTGSFTGSVTVSLQADSAGAPSGTPLATVTIANAAWLLQNAGAFLARWGTAYNAMTVGATYWYVIETSTTDNSNHPNLGTATAGGYGSGSVKFKNTTDGWTAIATIDLYFRGFTTRANKLVRADADGYVRGQLPYGVDAGATDAYEVNFSTDDTAYVDGRIYTGKIATANTGPATGNVNGWGAKAIKKNHNLALETGDYLANQSFAWMYNSTADVLEMLNPSSSLGPLSAARIGGIINATFSVSTAAGVVPLVVDTESFDILNEMDNGYQAVTLTAGASTTAVIASAATFSPSDVGRWWFNSTRSLYRVITAYVSPTQVTVAAIASQTSGDTGYVYSGLFTASVAGIYQVNATTNFGLAVSTQSVQMFLYKNGAAVIQKTTLMGNSGSTGYTVPATISDMVQLAAGDTLQVFVNSVSATETYGSSTLSNFFSVHRLS